MEDLLKEFEEEYRRDHGEVRQQERVEERNKHDRGEFPGQFTARNLSG